MAQISATPRDNLIDKHVDLQASGLSAGQTVTFFAQLKNDNQRFASYAHYVADHHGNVDLNTSPSLGGLYTGIEPMGLFWSMQQEDGQREGLRLVKKDVSTPYDVRLSLLDGYWSWTNLNRKPLDPLCQTNIYRRYQGEDVRRVDVRAGRVRGAMFIPPGNTARPGVIDFFGTAGGLMVFRAALLASHGFTTLSLAFFDYQDLPTSFADLQFSYFEEAVDWFSSQPEVQPGGVGVIGVSKGGELAMLMGIHCPAVKAAVSIGGPPHLTFADLQLGDTFLPSVPLDYSRVVTKDGAMITRDAFLYEDHHLFPYDQMKANCLILKGEDDQIYNPIHQQRIISELKPEHRSKFNIIVYPKTGHLIEPPHAPVCITSWHKAAGMICAWGGEKRSQAHAQVLAWSTLLDFLTQNLSPVSKL